MQIEEWRSWAGGVVPKERDYSLGTSWGLREFCVRRVQIGEWRSWAGAVVPKDHVHDCACQLPGGLRGFRVRVRVQIGECRSWAGRVVPKERDCA